MNKSKYFIAATVILFTACKNQDTEMVSQRYIHKYGYDVHKEEWEEQQYPGQVLTTYRTGKTIHETYEDTLLHGEKTISFEHSQTIHIKELYKKGILVKRTTYNIRGIPEKETVFKTPTHLFITSWYNTGSPRSKEEYKDGKLCNAQYFNIGNETDSCITNGNGERTKRNHSGDILSKEVYTNFEIAYIESYHINSTPETITSYNNGVLHGEKKVFAVTGEPLSVENYVFGKKHGISTYYQNGYKYQESTYENGNKNGLEKFYIDGVTLAEETSYKEGIKHGPSVIFTDGSAKTSWYFKNEKVSKKIFDRYEDRDQLISMKK